MISRQYMTLCKVSLDSMLKVSDALGSIEKFSVEYVPVTLEGKFKGFITKKMMSGLDADSSLADIVLVSSRSVSEDSHFFELIAAFSEQKTDVLAVTNKEGVIVGIISLSKFLDVMGRINAVWSPGGVVILEIHPSDYHLSEIAQIAESDDAGILAMFMYPSADGVNNEVVLKFNKEDLDSVISTFERYSYSVKKVYTDKIPDEDLMDRYNGLMNYLNI